LETRFWESKNEQNEKRKGGKYLKNHNKSLAMGKTVFVQKHMNLILTTKMNLLSALIVTK
jgi:hypothetical protein